ncbi:MAG: tetratricopeptide repeat protein [Candidatus Hydrogenedentes bacterium]|nr:tetratricopeptide repeat protein [Candidatus Hydrogenedentota bacterium]
MMVYQRHNTLWLFTGALMAAVFLSGCSSPEVRKQKAYDRGRALMESGETKKAILEFRNAIQIEPKFTDARYYLGICLLKEKNPAAALAELERVEGEQPSRVADLKPYKAEASVGAGKFAEGRDLLEDLVKDNPENASYHDLLSRAALGLSRAGKGQAGKDAGDSTEDLLIKASAEAEKALSLDPKLIEPHMTLAQVLVLKRRNPAMPSPITADDKKEIGRLLDAARAITPNDAATKGKISHPRLDFLNGRIWFAEGDFEKARDEFRKVKDAPSAGYFLALCLDKLDDHQHAISQFEQVLEQDPTYEPARRTLFEIYMKEENVAKATVQAEAAVKAALQSPLGYLLRARVCASKADWAGAHDSLDEALRFAPGMVDALLLQADVYRKEGDLDKSKAALDEVVRTQPNIAVGYLARSEVFLFQKNLQGAEGDAKKALELAPKDPLAQVAFARVRIARGDLDGAYGAYEKALEFAPDNSQVRLSLASLCAAKKEYDKGLTLLQAVGEKDALYVLARTRMAEFYDAKGDKTAAADEFAKLLAAHPETVDATSAFVQHLSKSEDLDSMAELAKATIQRDPDTTIGHLMLSEVHAARGLWGPAAEETQAAIKKLLDSARLWYRLGLLQASAGRFDDALAAASRASELRPEFDAATLLAARMLAQTGKGDDALALCAKVLEKKPDDPATNLTKADVQALLGKYSDAESGYRALISSQKTALLPYLRLAALYEKDQQNGGSEKAKKLFDEALAAIPNSAQLFVEYARYWERAKDGVQARQQYARALELAPGDQTIQDALARLAAAAGDFPDAEKRLREHLEKAPGDLSARLNLALVLENEGKVSEATQSLLGFVTASQDPAATGMEVSKLFASMGQYDKIERLAKTMIESDASNWMPHYALGIAYAGQGNAEQAQKEFKEAATLNSKSPLAKHAEGLMCARLNQVDEALAAFEAARQIETRFEPAYTDAALLLIRKGSYDRAEELCRKALEVQPASVKPALILASTYIKIARAPLALQIVDDLLKRDNKLAVAASTLADVFISAGLHDDAINLCQKCLAASPNTPSLVMKLGAVYEQAGKRDLAITEYQRVIQMQPKDPLAHNNLAWLLSEQGKLDDALTHAQLANDLRPGSPSIQDTLGLIHLKKGDNAKALPLLEASAKGAPQNPEILFHLGKAYSEAGRQSDAKTYLSRALELNANFPNASEAKKLLDGQ